MKTKQKFIFLSCLLIVSCANVNFNETMEAFTSEDFYLGVPGSKLFYRTTSKKTQENYHYSQCRKKILTEDQLRIESCVSSYWITANNI